MLAKFIHKRTHRVRSSPDWSRTGVGGWVKLRRTILVLGIAGLSDAASHVVDKGFGLANAVDIDQAAFRGNRVSGTVLL